MAAIAYGTNWVRIHLDDGGTFRAGINYFNHQAPQYVISNLVDYIWGCRFYDLTTAVECLVEALGNPVEVDYDKVGKNHG